MGMMNLSFFCDEHADKMKNIFQESSNQSHHSSAGYMALHPIIFDLSQNGASQSKRLLRYWQEDRISGYLNSTHPHHTSQKGVMILTTDYMVDLCLQQLPDDCENFEGALSALAREYRKSLMRYRYFIGRDHELVTKKKLISEKPELIERHGSEKAQAGKNPGHFVAMNFDCIHVDEDTQDSRAAKDISKAYHDLVETSETGVPYPVFGMHGGALHNYESLLHWASLTEGDVIILEYSHLLPTKCFFGTRKARTPAADLMDAIYELPDRSISESIHLKEYLLMKEFFGSQGYEINL